MGKAMNVEMITHKEQRGFETITVYTVYKGNKEIITTPFKDIASECLAEARGGR
jgi:hypothetical protein